jgi:hypothetical protein
MNIELKHLAPYLPYGLKLQGAEHKIFGIKDAVYELFKLSKGLNGNLIISGRVRSVMGGSFSIGETEIGKDSEFLLKPILRPMGDALSKCLNIDGREIYFSTWIAEKTGLEIDWQMDFEIESKNSYEETLYFPLLNSLKVYNLLLEYHFDVFGLIDAGLAINEFHLT